MRLLVVEGNKEETRIKRESFGIRPYHLIFTEMLHFLEPASSIDIVFPAHKDPNLPALSELKKFDGVLWTGSSLSVLDDTFSVNQQLEFAEDVFRSGVPFYGSCWGLQIATLVSGGKVAKSKNGLEIGISESIQLTSKGKQSSYFKDRKNDYRSLCIHYDEVSELPENTEVLAKNMHSEVQAMTINYRKSQFFGVQYHPEFRTQDMALIVSFLTKNLVESQYFSSETDAQNFISKLKDENKLPKEIAEYNLHNQEISSWLNQLKAR